MKTRPSQRFRRRSPKKQPKYKQLIQHWKNLKTRYLQKRGEAGHDLERKIKL